jgi:hypothetical protein
MADVNISMMLADQGNSIKRRTGETRELNGELTKTQRLAKSAFSGQTASGSPTSQSVMDYNRGRATIGTGAEARDFAKQSEGLSGLVRLYAIYAANLYAAGAAFTALREAAATETMIKGMDQLGARSGIALGSLAQRFSQATDGAISLRESVEATTKAVSSGLSQKQFIQLGEVAKKASQALGINMSDAVSRLTRGITKLEPELLDELGIFAKIGPATEKYANDLGKPVAALTDFERRQAFANAVLEEGLNKFGKLDLPANPYDKLTASLKNLAQTALEVVNKALLPLVSVLSQSPAALTGIIGLLGLSLIKQALPAIGQYREELKKTAELSKDIAAKKALESRETRLSAFGGALQKADDLATEAEDKATKTWEKVEKAVKTSSSKVAESVKPALAKLLSKDNLFDITQKDLKVLDDLGAKNTKIAATYRQLAQEIRNAQEAAKVFAAAKTAKAAEEAKPLPFFSAAGINQRIAQGAAGRAERAGIVSRAVEESSTGGFISSGVQLLRETKASTQMGTLGKSMTLISGAASIAGNAVVRLASSLGTIGMVVGVAAAAFAALDGWLSKTAEQAEKFNLAVKDSEAGVKTYYAALKIISEEGDPFKTEALTAASNAVKTLRDNFKDTITSYVELQKAIDTSFWDSFTNSVAGLFGRGAADTFSKTQVANLEALVSAASRYGKEQELILTISEALGADRSQWAEKVAKDGPKAAEGLKKIQPVLEKIVASYGNADEASKRFDNTLKELRTEQQNLITSLQDQTAGGKFASKLLQFAIDFKGAIGNTETAVSRLNNLLAEQKNLGLFSPETANGLMQITEQVKRINEENNKVTTNLREQQQLILSLQAEEGALQKRLQSRNPFVSILGDKEAKRYQELPQLIQTAQASATRLAQQRAELDADIAKLMKDPRIGKAITESIIKSVDYMTRELDLTFRKAALSVKQNALSGLAGQAIPGIAEAQYKLDMEGINLQRAANSTLEEIARLNSLTLAVQTQALAASLAKESRGPGEGPTQFQNIAENFFKAISGNKGQKDVIDQIKKYMPGAAVEESAALQGMLQSLLSSRGTLGKNAEFNAQERIAGLNKIINKLQEEFNIKAKYQALDASTIQAQLEILNINEQIKTFLTEDEAIRKTRLLDQKAELDYQAKIQKIELDRNTVTQRLIAAGEMNSTRAAELEIQEGKEKANALQERNNTLIRNGVGLVTDLNKQSEYNLGILNKKIDLERQILQIAEDRLQLERSSALEFAELELELKEKTVLMTERQQKEERRRLEVLKLNANIEDKRQQALKDYSSKLIEIGKNSPTEGYDPLAMDAAGEAGKALESRLRLLDLERNKKLEILNINDDLLNRQKAYSDVFESTFEKMADAIVEFARTGKLNFKDLINSMLADLLRYELRLQMMAMYQSLRPGLMNLVGSLFGGGAGSTPGYIPGLAGADFPSYMAKGGAFDEGIKKYAKGGMFTNSIVDSPTMFKFAKGTGLMGEAGPEAIMPLKRDSQGNLGVRGGSGGNVEVVVNNYSTAQAETRETTDSRGNRKIEVVVGDMTAGEVTRGGSSTNRAIRSTFGMSPQLIRR